ncbi:MAG: hypothetical protein WC054_13155 [Candidatus Nanopelagicales bacterium]
MPWIRLDDNFDQHPKFVEAGPLGIALWACALAWCNRTQDQHRSKGWPYGFIPTSKIRTLIDLDGISWRGWSNGLIGSADEATAIDIADHLVTHDIFEPVDGGYLVHDYEEFQRPDHTLDVSVKRTEAGRNGGVRSGATRRAEAKPEAKPEAFAQAKPKPVPVPVLQTTDVIQPTTPDPVDNLSVVVIEAIKEYAEQLPPPRDGYRTNRRNWLRGVRRTTEHEQGPQLQAHIATHPKATRADLIALLTGTPPSAPQPQPDCPDCLGNGMRWNTEATATVPCECRGAA